MAVNPLYAEIDRLKARITEKDVAIDQWADVCQEWKDRFESTLEQIAALTTDRDTAMSQLKDAEARVHRFTMERDQVAAENEQLKKALVKIRACNFPFLDETQRTCFVLARDALGQTGPGGGE